MKRPGPLFHVKQGPAIARFKFICLPYANRLRTGDNSDRCQARTPSIPEGRTSHPSRSRESSKEDARPHISHLSLYAVQATSSIGTGWSFTTLGAVTRSSLASTRQAGVFSWHQEFEDDWFFSIPSATKKACLRYSLLGLSGPPSLRRGIRSCPSHSSRNSGKRQIAGGRQQCGRNAANSSRHGAWLHAPIVVRSRTEPRKFMWLAPPWCPQFARESSSLHSSPACGVHTSDRTAEPVAGRRIRLPTSCRLR